VAHIRPDEFGFSAERAQLSHELLAGFLMATGKNGAVTLPRESQSRRTPDSSKRAGDQDNRGTHLVAPSDLAGPEAAG
jgi:hypothetical protein